MPPSISGFDELYQCVLNGARKCNTVWDLHSLFMREVLGYMFNQTNKNFRDLTETYSWVASKKVSYTTLSVYR